MIFHIYQLHAVFYSIVITEKIIFIELAKTINCRRLHKTCLTHYIRINTKSLNYFYVIRDVVKYVRPKKSFINRQT